MNTKDHWERVFTGKQAHELSWYQQSPLQSLVLLKQLQVPKTAAIIDIGAGDSFFVDLLLKKGYSNITVLDISATAIDKARQRLGKKAARVSWIVSDILDFKSTAKFDCWHDRAAFHFLTGPQQVEDYLSVAEQHINPAGKLIIGTFSTQGPEKCSGLRVKQYDEKTLVSIWQKWFEKIRCITTDHITPFKTIQNFIFCSFQKISITNGHS